VRRSSYGSALVALAALIAGSPLARPLLQGPGTRVTYRIRIIEPAAVAPRVLASGAVSGPLDTDMRLTLRTDTTEIEALFQVTPVGDTVNLGAEFFTKRRVGRSRRGLPMWEQDTYRRVVRLAWNDTARVYPFGSARRSGTSRAAWVELVLQREFLGGEARPAEELDLADSTRDVRLEAVVRPRRARVTLNLLRGDTVSAPRPMDLVPEEPARLVQLVLGRRVTTVEVSLTRPPPARSPRDRALALDVDVVCLRVAAPAGDPIGAICGRLNSVAKQLPLPTGDTLAATFAWPGFR
jgi:hypothetical protein